jgi:hypothetical protein
MTAQRGFLRLNALQLCQKQRSLQKRPAELSSRDR